MDPDLQERIKVHLKAVAPPHPTYPSEKLPPPVTGNTARAPERWAYVSIVDRLPAIVRQLEKANSLTKADADKLCDSITQNSILPTIHTGPDAPLWNETSNGLRWLEASWLFVEALLYRHIADITKYFENKIDPFYSQKMDSLRSALGSIEALETEFTSVLLQQKPGDLKREHFDVAIEANLWSNKSDLSKNPEGGSVGKLIHDLEHLRPWILINDTDAVFDTIMSQESAGKDLHFIVDNAGLEIVTDLYLAELLLHHRKFKSVIIQVKYHPTFVSDVIEDDIQHTLKFMADRGEKLAAAAARWSSLLADGKLKVQSNKFWNHFLPFWQLQTEEKALWDQLVSSAGLVIVKGDANARRMHGDLMWNFTEPASNIVSYLPFPCVNIRTLKSETASGLTQAQVDAMTNPKWYYDGIWGTIQYFAPTQQRRL